MNARRDCTQACSTCARWSHRCTDTSSKSEAAAAWFKRNVHHEPGRVPLANPSAQPCPAWAAAWPTKLDWMRGKGRAPATAGGAE